MRTAARMANLAWMAVNAGGWRRFRADLHRVRETQESILARCLRANAETDFGRRHGFSRLRSARDYQDRVPLSTYEDYQPYIERIAAGEPGVLTRGRVKLLEPSSGSTRAAKWIPYTAQLQAEIRGAVAPWAYDLFTGRPHLLGGPAYWSITPLAACAPREPTTIPVGFEDDAAYLGGSWKHLVGAALAVPAQVRLIRDMDLFRRVTLVYLLRCGGLRLISVWHPTFLTLLVRGMQDGWADLLGDLERGMRLPEAGIEIPADPGRARALRALGSAQPRGIWPRLGLISCWGDGHASLHLAELGRMFPGVEIQTKGLIATEAFVSLPFQGRKPLAVASHFFEFLDSGGRPRLAHEVEREGRYSVVVTTGGGLYRYQLHDRVEVTASLGQAPCLRFLGKEDHVSDLCGEKLNEGHVAEVLGRALALAQIRPGFAMLAPDTEGGPRYVLYLEASGVPAGLAEALETALRENPHYDYCARLGQLAPVAIHPVGEGAYDRYVGRLMARGQRAGSIKPAALSGLSGWREVFRDAATRGAAAHP